MSKRTALVATPSDDFDHGLFEQAVRDAAEAAFKSGEPIFQTNPGVDLFPETLRAELHEVRSVIEAFSKRGNLTMPPPDLGPPVCGLGIRPDQPINQTLRATTDGVPQAYKIDRWD